MVGIVGYEHESGCAWVCGCVGVPAAATYSQLAMSVDTSADRDTQTDTAHTQHTHTNTHSDNEVSSEMRTQTRAEFIKAHSNRFTFSRT